MGLPSDDLRALDQLLGEVLDLAGDARARWLDALPAEYTRLKPALQDLLTAHGNAAASGGSPVPAALAAGDRIGPYRLLRELGAGGMGVVWLAEGADGHLKRQVALKLPHVVLNNRAQGGRFARERDILASLAHPNIARLYDAGITAQGQPYLALEFVEGEPLLAHCDAHRLPLRARLALFGQVLRAVQHAHANLVIHRDLKPSNILVTPAGDVRLLDFGIAKLVTDGDAAETELTRIAGSAHTPAYASPEQVASAPVSTASDVYSLGVILYELLCGARPYRPTAAGRAALEDAILRQDPAAPSARATDEAAAARGVAPARKLAALLAGDLDTIAAKALKKRPGDRYPTVAALAEDIDRHLRGAAIEARADSAWYRTRKLVARNRVAFGAAALVAASLVAGTSVAVWQARAAHAEAARANAVQQFVLDLFRANSADQADPQRARQATARELLDLGVARIATAFPDQPQARLEILDTLAKLYAELGLWVEAGDLAQQQVALARALYGDRDARVAEAIVTQVNALDMRDRGPSATVPALIAEAEAILAAAGDEESPTRARLLEAAAGHYLNRTMPQAREHAERAVAIYRRAHPDDAGFPDALATLANIQLRHGEWPAAQATITEALAVARARRLSEFRLVHFLRRAGEINAWIDNIAEADAQLREALAISERVNGPQHPATNIVRRALQRHLLWTSRTDEAEALARDVLANDRAHAGGETYLVEDTRRMLIELHSNRGDLEAERAVAAEAIAAYGETIPDTFQAAALLVSRASSLAASGDTAAALAALQHANAIAGRLGVARGSMLRGNLAVLESRARIDAGDPDAARAILVEQLSYWKATDPGVASSRAVVHALLVTAMLAGGDVPEALRTAALADAEFTDSKVRPYFVATDAQLEVAHGLALTAAGDCARALPHLERGAALYRRVHVASSPWLGEADAHRAICLFRLDRRADAQVALAAARAALAPHPRLGTQFTQPLRRAEQLAHAQVVAPAWRAAAR